MTKQTAGHNQYSYIAVISRIHYRFYFICLLYGIADGLATERPHQRGDAGVCVGRHDMCLAL